MKLAICTAAFAAIGLVSALAANADDGRAHVDTSGVNMQPDYPASALATKESGEAILDVVVAPSGSVERIALRHSTSFNDLDRAAISAVMNWHFVPAQKDGSPIEGIATVAVAFAPPGSETSLPKTAPARDYFPQVLVQEASVDAYDHFSARLPCDNGTLFGSMKLSAPGNRVWIAKYSLSGWFKISAGDAESVFSVAELDTWSQIKISMQHWESGDYKERHFFMGGAHEGAVVHMVISWDQNGNVTSGSDLEKITMRLSKVPDTYEIAASGIKATWTDLNLVCVPPQRN